MNTSPIFYAPTRNRKLRLFALSTTYHCLDTMLRFVEFLSFYLVVVGVTGKYASASL
jgi:hypothetical protein